MPSWPIPPSAADFAFLLHGFPYLKEEGVMAIILPHGVLFRGGAEERIRTKLLKDGHIDTVIGLPRHPFAWVPIHRWDQGALSSMPRCRSARRSPRTSG